MVNKNRSEFRIATVFYKDVIFITYVFTITSYFIQNIKDF